MEWVLAYVAQGEVEAMVVRSFLDSNGIEIREAKEALDLTQALMPNAPDEVKIYVTSDKLEEVKELLSQQAV